MAENDSESPEQRLLRAIRRMGQILPRGKVAPRRDPIDQDEREKRPPARVPDKPVA